MIYTKKRRPLRSTLDPKLGEKKGDSSAICDVLLSLLLLLLPPPPQLRFTNQLFMTFTCFNLLSSITTALAETYVTSPK